MIRKLKTGQYRLYSRKTDPDTGKRRNLGTFDNREAAETRTRSAVFQAPLALPAKVDTTFCSPDSIRGSETLRHKDLELTCRFYRNVKCSSST